MLFFILPLCLPEKGTLSGASLELFCFSSEVVAGILQTLTLVNAILGRYAQAQMRIGLRTWQSIGRFLRFCSTGGPD